MSDPSTSGSELEVHFKPESGKAVIEGKTVVPFQSFVALILQRKVTTLFKLWGKHPIIIESELLTHLASAPQDSVENRGNLIMVTLMTGALGGITLFAIVQLALLFVKIPLGVQELSILIGSVLFLILLLVFSMKSRSKPKNDKLVETMEQISTFLSKK